MYSFSVITVVKNNAHGLNKTLASVFSQKDVELQSIVIDGKSIDNTLEICKKYPRIDVLISEEDKGIYDAMNKGIYHAKHEWIIFLNADDIFYNEHSLNDIMTFLNQNQETDIICGKTIEIFHGQEKVYENKNIDEMPIHMPACHQSILIKTKILQTHLFNSSYKICGDLELISRLIKGNHSILYYPKVITYIDGVGVSNKWLFTTMRERKKIQEEYYPDKHIALVKYHRKVVLRWLLRSLLPIKLQLIIRKILNIAH